MESSLALNVNATPFLSDLPFDGALSVGALAVWACAAGAVRNAADSAATRKRGRVTR